MCSLSQSAFYDLSKADPSSLTFQFNTEQSLSLCAILCIHFVNEFLCCSMPAAGCVNRQLFANTLALLTAYTCIVMLCLHIHNNIICNIIVYNLHHHNVLLIINIIVVICSFLITCTRIMTSQNRTFAILYVDDILKKM